MQRTSGLTKARFRVLRAISDYRTKYSFPPSVREVARIVGSTSSPVEMHIQSLIEDGYITRQPSQARSVVLTESGQEAVRGRRVA